MNMLNDDPTDDAEDEVEVWDCAEPFGDETGDRVEFEFPETSDGIV